jgi:hypothetical protein
MFLASSRVPLLIERVTTDKTLRRLCGWERAKEILSEATFSRAFAEFAASALPTRVHDALIARTQKDRLVGHISRDSTAIEVREKPAKVAAPEKPKYKPGRDTAPRLPCSAGVSKSKNPGTRGTPLIRITEPASQSRKPMSLPQVDRIDLGRAAGLWVLRTYREIADTL